MGSMIVPVGNGIWIEKNVFDNITNSTEMLRFELSAKKISIEIIPGEEASVE